MSFLYSSFVSYLYVSYSGSITSVWEETAIFSALSLSAWYRLCSPWSFYIIILGVCTSHL